MRPLCAFCYALAIGLGLYFWGPVIDAKWGLIDDHEVMYFVGTGDHMPLSRVPVVLAQTELSSQSGLARYRPSYYALRMAEAMAWGKNPTLWYGFRIAVALIFMLAVVHVCLQAVGPILTLGFLPFVFSSLYWSDVFGRAGVGETYCALGLALIALAWGVRPRPYLSTTRVAMILLGVVIAAGSKENFLLLGVLPLWLLVGRRPRIGLLGKAMALAALVFLGWIVVMVFLRLRNTGTDVYANDVSPLYRLKLLLSFFSLSVVQYWLVGLAVLFAASFAVKSLRVHFLVACLLLAIYGTQFVFYAGHWPRNTEDRYLFPGILAYHGAILVGFSAVVEIMNTLSIPRQAVVGAQVAGAAVLIFWSLDGFASNREASYKVVSRTAVFDRNFAIVASHLRNDPSRVLVINSHYFNDFEPIFSIERFVRANGLPNPVALRVDHKASAPGSHQETLSRALERLSHEGQPGLFVPLSTVDRTHCYSVGMSGPFLETCDGGGLVIYP